ncbi:hypothetical protein Tco_1302646 [Tanacetum coccineum]
MDDEPMWTADHIVALTHGSAITIPETTNEFVIKALFDRLLKEIRAFSQHENESMTDAWLLLLKLDWAKNQKTKTSLKKTIAFADEVADKQSGRPFGSLPRNTQPNPRGNNSKAYQPPQARNEHVNVVFTESGKSYNPPKNPNEEQNKTENPINFDSNDEDDEPTPQPKTQT